jgi:hypothetical protein
VNGLAGDALVVVDGLVVVLVHRGQVRHLQEVLVRKTRMNAVVSSVP